MKLLTSLHVFSLVIQNILKNNDIKYRVIDFNKILLLDDNDYLKIKNSKNFTQIDNMDFYSFKNQKLYFLINIPYFEIFNQFLQKNNYGALKYYSHNYSICEFYSYNYSTVSVNVIKSFFYEVLEMYNKEKNILYNKNINNYIILSKNLLVNKTGISLFQYIWLVYNIEVENIVCFKKINDLYIAKKYSIKISGASDIINVKFYINSIINNLYIKKINYKNIIEFIVLQNQIYNFDIYDSILFNRASLFLKEYNVISMFLLEKIYLISNIFFLEEIKYNFSSIKRIHNLFFIKKYINNFSQGPVIDLQKFENNIIKCNSINSLIEIYIEIINNYKISSLNENQYSYIKNTFLLKFRKLIS
ncbi:hypothetical protein AB837_00332 [bacterium AB1]|nr:hypothetical protein AB837_00332 [bacterium AB1]